MSFEGFNPSQVLESIEGVPRKEELWFSYCETVENPTFSEFPEYISRNIGSFMLYLASGSDKEFPVWMRDRVEDDMMLEE